MPQTQFFKFFTGSTYDGAWRTDKECMHGFGCYVYPDGSNYRGYFQEGKFHGFGCLQLEPPYKFQIKGFFENGQLVTIEDMLFSDGLHVTAEVKNGKLDFAGWRYCSVEDRRFPMEISQGLKAVGQTPSTQQFLERKLQPGVYDTEEGVFSLKTGFVLARPPPYNTAKFVACQEDIDWITRYCRKGYESEDKLEPNRRVCRQTMNTNIEGQNLMDMKYGPKCAPSQKAGHKYFAKLYAMELEEARKAMRRQSGAEPTVPTYDHGVLMKDSSTTCSSFSDEKLSDDVKARVCDVTEALMGRSNISLSLDFSALNVQHKIFN